MLSRERAPGHPAGDRTRNAEGVHCELGIAVEHCSFLVYGWIFGDQASRHELSLRYNGITANSLIPGITTTVSFG